MMFYSWDLLIQSHLFVKNNKGRVGGVGLLIFFPWKGGCLLEGGGGLIEDLQ